MKNLYTKISFILLAIMLFAFTAFSQCNPNNAPITSIGSLSALCGDAITFPVRAVSCFNSIGTISLRLYYNPSQLTFVSTSNKHTALANMTLTNTPVNVTSAYIAVDWSDMNGVTLPDNSLLFNIHYIYNSGPTIISFDNTGASGSYCEYANTIGDVLNDAPTATYYINGYVTPGGPSNAKNILSFTLPTQTEAATINTINHTVNIQVAAGTNVAAATPTISISPCATISPASGTVHDFTTPFTYTLTAQDESSQAWVVTVTVANPVLCNCNDIITFTLPQQSEAANINTTNHTVSIQVASCTVLTSLTPTISVSTMATISPASGITQNFTNPVTYFVTDESDSTQAWIVTVFSPVLAIARDIITFTLPQQTAPATINNINHTVNISVAAGTAVTALIPTITVSPITTISPASGTAQDFTNPVTYILTSEDCVSDTWVVTVTTSLAQPGAISGSSTVCTASHEGYHISAVPGATSYTWTLPSGWVGSSTSTSIITTVGSSSGIISVTANNSSGSSTPSTLAVTVNPMPVITSTTKTDVTLCGICDGTIIINAIGTPVLTYSISNGINFSTSTNFTGLCAGNYPIVVKNGYGCTSSWDGDFVQILDGGPLPSPVVSGDATYCSGTTAANLTATAGYGGTLKWYKNSVQVGTGTSFNPNTYLVVGINNFYVSETTTCEGAGRLVVITVNPLPSAAGAISGTANVCQGQSNVSYLVPVIDNASSYTWGYSGTGATISGTTNPMTINFSSTATTGILTVRGTNACGNGIVSANYHITVNPLPAAAGTISGPTIVCRGQSVLYSIPPIIDINHNIGYSWSYSGTGATIWGSSSSIVNFSTTATSGYFTVMGTNYCGNGPVSANYPITFYPNCDYLINGVVSYKNSSNTSLSGVTVNLMNGTSLIASANTISNGVFTLTNIPNGTYNLDANTSRTWNGVTATDALLIKRHLVGLELFTEPIRLTAADVNNSNTITATDVLKLQRRVAGMDASFARPNWIFEKTSIGGNSITVNNANVTQNIYALCTGDVNGSNNPTILARHASVSLNNNSTIKANLNETIELPIRVSNATEIGAMQLFVDYPANLIEVVGVTMNSKDDVLYHAENGNLRIVWSSLESMILNENDVIVTVKLKVISTAGNVSISIQNESEIADATGNVINELGLNTSSIELSDASDINSKFNIKNSKILIYPNPSQNNVYVNLGKYSSKDVTVSIYNTIGKQVSLISKSETDNLFKLNFSGLSDGLYIIQINTPDGKVVKTVSINK